MELTLNGQAVRPLQTVTFYTCGMTPCGLTHLGHARLFIVCDAIKRVMSGLLHCTVLDGINVTDVDDKIINGQRRRDNRFETLQTTRSPGTTKLYAR